MDALQTLQATLQEQGAPRSADEYAGEIAQLVREAKFRYRNETQLQQGLNFLFELTGLQVLPEAVLTRGERIDFWINLRTARIGVEVKIKGSTPMVRAQLARYAATGKVDALVLVTSRGKHRSLHQARLPGPPAADNHVLVTVARLPWL